jgi:hypothetical protein
VQSPTICEAKCADAMPDDAVSSAGWWMDHGERDTSDRARTINS